MLVGCFAPTSQALAEPLKLLFLGNSLTFSNDLPAVVRALGKVDGVAIKTRTIANPNAALEDHWRSSRTQRLVAEGNWDYVVMQQGPSSLAKNQRNLRDWSVRWSEAIRAAGAQPAMYMVWPSARHFRSFDAVGESYANAAVAADAKLLPAGRAWLEAWRLDPGLKLYGRDGFHPSPMGTLLAAIVIYAGVTGGAPETLPARIKVGERSVRISEATEKVLLAAVAELMVPAERVDGSQ